MLQRPYNFRINPFHSLAKGLVFAGLGAHAGSTLYHDSSVFGRINGIVGSAYSYSRGLGRSVITWSDSNATSYVSYAANMPQFTGAFTLSVWAKILNLNWAQFPLFGSDSTTGGYDFDLCCEESGAGPGRWRWRTRTAYTTVDIYSDNNAAQLQWVHVCARRRNDSYFDLWIDGVQQTATGTASGTHDNIDVFNLFANEAGSQFHKGSTADPMIWLREVSYAEIQQLADPSNVMLSGLILPPARRWWPVSGPTSTKTKFLILSRGTKHLLLKK